MRNPESPVRRRLLKMLAASGACALPGPRLAFAQAADATDIVQTA